MLSLIRKHIEPYKMLSTFKNHPFHSHFIVFQAHRSGLLELLKSGHGLSNSQLKSSKVGGLHMKSSDKVCVAIHAASFDENSFKGQQILDLNRGRFPTDILEVWAQQMHLPLFNCGRCQARAAKRSGLQSPRKMTWLPYRQRKLQRRNS